MIVHAVLVDVISTDELICFWTCARFIVLQSPCRDSSNLSESAVG